MDKITGHRGFKPIKGQQVDTRIVQILEPGHWNCRAQLLSLQPLFVHNTSTVTWQHESAESRGKKQMTLPDELFCTVARSEVDQDLWGRRMLHQRDDEEMMLDEFSAPNRFGAFVCKRALHSDMFTSKYRRATGAHKAVISSQFQALTKLGGSQSSRRHHRSHSRHPGAIRRDANVAVALKGEFGPR